MTDEAEGTRGACPAGMVDVRGSMKIDGERGTVEGLQDTTCTDWISHDFPERCARFDAERWQLLAQELPVKAQHFCIDRFEYPDRKGAYPIIAVTWREAVGLCEDRGARLCSEDEWTFACEGEDARPYPTGFVRDEKACVIDRPWRLFDERLFAVRDSAFAIGEIDYVWQGEASGARPLLPQPLRRLRHDGQRRRVDPLDAARGLRIGLQGRLLGAGARALPRGDPGAQRGLLLLSAGFRCCADAPRRRRGSLETGSDEPPTGGRA